MPTQLDAARAELVSDLVAHGSPWVMSSVVRFVDAMAEIATRLGERKLMDPAAAAACSRVSTELEAAARAALTAPPPPAAELVPDPDEDLDRLADVDAERDEMRIRELRLRHKPRSAKWNRRRNKRKP